ncbi:MAG: response regulator [Burkholderiales bacterium]
MGSLRVALVDDSERIRSRVAEMVAEIANAEIVFAADTEGDAVRLLAQQDWDVLILDLQLRIGTGLGVLKAMQGLRREGRIALVFTNYAFRQYRERATALGADHFFDKARDFDALRATLRAKAEQAAAH